MWILTYAYFTETFQPMSAASTFEVGLNNCAQVIWEKVTFAADLKYFQRKQHISSSTPSCCMAQSMCEIYLFPSYAPYENWARK